MKSLLTILLAIAILSGKATAQDSQPYGYYLDALRFSKTYTGGTAMNLALGGANVALGAEMTSISGNPAGLGLYNRSEFSFTPGFTFANNATTANGIKYNNQDIYAHLDNIGIVINNTHAEIKGWLGGSFGFSVNKINDFRGEYKYNMGNDQNSIVDYFIESANGFPASDFPYLEDATDLTTLAYYTYLIGPLNVIDETLPDNEYFSDVTSFARPVVTQTETIRTDGSQYQWSLAYGGNLADVLYIGLGMGIVSLNYSAEKLYTESDFDYSADPDDPSYNPINQLELNEELNISGTGINGTFGLILRPVSFIRLGASITTPTVYQITDSYQGSLATDWNDFFYGDLIGGDTTLNYMEASTAELLTKYKLSTPFKASFGAAVFLGKLGFITADLEYLDYSTAWLEGNDFSLDNDNSFIQANYTQAMNLKIGAEMRLDALRFRGGYALDQVPITADLDYNSSNHRISLGAGLHVENFFADFTVVNSFATGTYSPYALADGSEPVIELKKNNYSGFLTLGFKF